jgi:hypothetical protein
VLGLDNGDANRSERLARLLAEHQVVPLFNVPRTPQHNAFVERAIGELNCVILAGGPQARLPEASRGPVRSPEPGVSRTKCILQRLVDDARYALDRAPRHSLGGRSPADIDSSAPRAEDVTCRAGFYADTRAALAHVAQLDWPPRARRRADREAVFSTLEQHGLVRRTRGGCRPSRPSKGKGIT